MPFNETFGGEFEDRFVSPIGQGEDKDSDNGLRPKTLAEYVGQQTAKQNLSVFIEAARKRGEALDHCLLYGPPGLGKTKMFCFIGIELCL